VRAFEAQSDDHHRGDRESGHSEGDARDGEKAAASSGPQSRFFRRFDPDEGRPILPRHPFTRVSFGTSPAPRLEAVAAWMSFSIRNYGYVCLHGHLRIVIGTDARGLETLAGLLGRNVANGTTIVLIRSVAGSRT
jgi:hypothetical protein